MSSTLAIGMDFLVKQEIKTILDSLEHLNKQDDVMVSYPLIYTQTQLVDGKKYSPFVMVDSKDPGKMVYGYYPDLDKDKNVHKTITKYFFYKILDKWLYDDFRSLLAFIKIVDGRPQLIRSISDYKPNALDDESVENIEKRIDYMEKILLTKDLVRHILKKIVTENAIHWYHLNKYEHMVKKTMFKYLKSKIEEAIQTYSKK